MENKKEFVWTEEDGDKAKSLWYRFRWYMPLLSFYLIYSVEGGLQQIHYGIFILSIMFSIGPHEIVYNIIRDRFDGNKYRDEVFFHTTRLVCVPFGAVLLYQGFHFIRPWFASN